MLVDFIHIPVTEVRVGHRAVPKRGDGCQAGKAEALMGSCGLLPSLIATAEWVVGVPLNRGLFSCQEIVGVLLVSAARPVE